MTIIKVYRERKDVDEHVDGAFTLQNALKKARSAAGGRRAALRRRGTHLGYRGPYGFFYVDEPEAKVIEEQNREQAGGRLKGIARTLHSARIEMGY